MVSEFASNIVMFELFSGDAFGPGSVQLLIASPLVEVGTSFRGFHFYPYRNSYLPIPHGCNTFIV
jgi:hypothetical protein